MNTFNKTVYKEGPLHSFGRMWNESKNGGKISYDINFYGGLQDKSTLACVGIAHSYSGMWDE